MQIILSIYSIGLFFLLVTYAALLLLWRASGRSRALLATTAGWIIIQSAVAVTGFYTVTDTVPPRFILLVGPPAAVIAMIFFTVRVKKILNGFNNEVITYIHSTRIGAEIVLFLLAEVHFVPKLLTWEGSNFDLLTGLTAPLIGYFGLRKNYLSKSFLLSWNIAGMVLLVNVAYLGIFSAPSPFQRFSFDQPNQLPLYFPFILLPAFLVPLMMFAHLTVIRSILHKAPDQ